MKLKKKLKTLLLVSILTMTLGSLIGCSNKEQSPQYNKLTGATK